ncbi:hypothetical protein EJB05_06518, partial [Eragrostis curvula]
MDHPKQMAAAAAGLTDDLIIEILSRLPHWRSLITHPEHRRKLPQTLSGFFYPSRRLDEENDNYPDFVDISGDEEQPFSNPKLPFLTGYRLIIPLMCCGGLLLCFCWKVSPRDEANYIVCNPATEKFVALPESDYDTAAPGYRLGFDPVISSHFHVFEILEGHKDYGYITGVNIYSSETGQWSHNGNGWIDDELQVVYSRAAAILHENLGAIEMRALLLLTNPRYGIA